MRIVFAIMRYHNSVWETSRAVLALIRKARVAPYIIEYLKAPPDRAALDQLAAHAGGMCVLLRDKQISALQRLNRYCLQFAV